ncbi:MAG: hypothetical protein CMO78_08245 [Verrucomicrobiales bacterium]|nr:hypothetical protein [Verrucomicrobiales bacterium]|tara:strand:+ start:369 stop:1883 length:1515 start_codon:yes stop_codon:yes gene_type:complete
MRIRAGILALFAAVNGQLTAAEWNQFRGPNGSGVATAKPPVKIDPAKPTWKVPVPVGHSSPVLWGGKIFLTGVVEGRMATLAYEAATGNRLWVRKAPEVPLERVHQASSHAAPTPVVDADRLFVYFGSFGLICYDHAGKELWQKKLPVPRTLYGTSSSPIGYGKHLILVLDDDNNLPRSRLSRSKVVAFNKADGETAWETARPFHRSGWSTPVVWKQESGDELVVLGNGALRGYALPSGRERWHVTGFSRETISAPIIGDGVVYASASRRGGGGNEKVDPEPFWKSVIHFDANKDGKLQRKEMTGHFTFPFRPELPYGHPGYGMPLPKDPRQRARRLDGIFGWMDKNRDGVWTREEFVGNFGHGSGKPLLIAVKPGGRGDITGSHLAWEYNRGIAEIPTPLAHGGRIYYVRSGGILTALRAATGKPLYSERLGASGQYSASPILANGHLYLASEPGQITIVQAGDELNIVHRVKLGDRIHVTPAMDENTIYVRSEKHLWAFKRP